MFAQFSCIAINDWLRRKVYAPSEFSNFNAIEKQFHTTEPFPLLIQEWINENTTALAEACPTGDWVLTNWSRTPLENVENSRSMMLHTTNSDNIDFTNKTRFASFELTTNLLSNSYNVLELIEHRLFLEQVAGLSFEFKVNMPSIDSINSVSFVKDFQNLGITYLEKESGGLHYLSLQMTIQTPILAEIKYEIPRITEITVNYLQQPIGESGDCPELAVITVT